MHKSGLVLIDVEPDSPDSPELHAATTTSSLLHFPQLAQPAQLTSSVGPSTPPKFASSAPDSMIPDTQYNLLEDIRLAHAQYSATGRERVALYNFPSYLTTNIRRVLARNRNHKADWSIAMSCLLWQGLARYSALPATQALGSALLALDTDDELESLAGEQVEMWRRGFRFSVIDPTHTMGLEKCRSFKAPEPVHSELFEMAGRLGLSGSTLGTVAVMAALENQDGVLSEHGKYMREAVSTLDGLIAERERRLRGLVRSIEAGVWR